MTSQTPQVNKPSQVADNPVASEWWDKLLPQLEAADKWADEYAAMFAVLCIAIADYLDVCERLNAPGITDLLISRKGAVYRNPLVDLKAQHANTVARGADAFGMFPKADAKLKAGPGGDIGGLIALMGGPPTQ